MPLWRLVSELVVSLRKEALRETYNQAWCRLRNLNQLSQRVCDFVRVYLSKSQNVMFYAAMQDEINLDPLIERWLPGAILPVTNYRQRSMQPRRITNWDDLTTTSYGIREPGLHCEQIALEDLDAVVVPGRVFDWKRNRVGRGYGFYDRFLAALPSKVKKIGVALDFQLIDEAPCDEHDIPMDIIFTESGGF